MTFKPGVAEQIKRQAIRSGQPIPDRILHAPQLPMCLEFFVKAFWSLHSCRSIGMGEGPIPFTAIVEYGLFYDCEHELIEDLIEYVQLLDQAYLNYQGKKAKSKAKK